MSLASTVRDGLMRHRVRWRACLPGEVPTVVKRLVEWPCEPGGAVRHMFPLAALEEYGHDAMKIATHEDRWAAAVVFPGRLVVPCGDADVIRAAGVPARRWRLLVGDAAAADAVLDAPDVGTRVHVQRFMTVDPERVPAASDQPDPGLRRAESADVPVLTDLAVQLHIDDRFGPHPGRAGVRGYQQRIEASVRRGIVYCVGPVGRPIVKLERSVSSRRWGVQLAGIVVTPDERGKGLGTAAVAEAVRAALAEARGSRPISLHVREDNTTAIHAYERAGFTDSEEWRLAVRS